MFKFISVLSVALILSACSLNPTLEQTTVTQTSDAVQVEVTTGVFVNLPQPKQLQQTLNVSQLISAQWGETGQQKLLVQLQVDQKQVVLAGFSSWGARILSLEYSGIEIETYVLAGLAETLPKPEQVLFNVMLSIWPAEAWTEPLQQIGWQLVESDKQRLLLDQNKQTIVEISYETTPYLAGLITFKHIPLDYTIEIETHGEQ